MDWVGWWSDHSSFRNMEDDSVYDISHGHLRHLRILVSSKDPLANLISTVGSTEHWSKKGPGSPCQSINECGGAPEPRLTRDGAYPR